MNAHGSTMQLTGKIRADPPLRFLGLGIIALSVTGVGIASQDPKPAESSKPANSQAAATSEAAASSSKPAEYVGSETCQACHEDIFKSFLRNRHHTVEVSQGDPRSESAVDRKGVRILPRSGR